MNKHVFLLAFILQVSCGDKSSSSQTAKGISDLMDTGITNNAINSKEGESNIKDNIFYKKDTLSVFESKILLKIAKENEFLTISKYAERFYDEKNGQILFSKLIYSNEDIDKGGYVSLEVFINGDVQKKINISYEYNMGQASTGYGYVVGEAVDDYLHTIKSCGMSSCVIQVFDSGNKIFEKEISN